MKKKTQQNLSLEGKEEAAAMHLFSFAPDSKSYGHGVPPVGLEIT